MIRAKLILKNRTRTEKRLDKQRAKGWAWYCPEKVIEVRKITAYHSGWKRRVGFRAMLYSI